MSEWDKKERRIKPDSLKLTVRYLMVIAWSSFIVAIIVSYYAAPEEDYALLRYKVIDTRDYWLTPLTDYLLYIIYFGAALSIISLIIDRYRTRRATDSKHFNLVMLLVLCIAWASYIIFHVYRNSL